MGEKIFVREMEGGGYEGTDVDVGRGSKINSARIFNANETVSIEVSEDFRNASPVNPVPGAGGGRGLKEIDGFTRSDSKGLISEDGLVGGLINIKGYIIRPLEGSATVFDMLAFDEMVGEEERGVEDAEEGKGKA